ncbi:enoyl-CoA hydratase/isomerase family protein [Roseomonas sp. AR75]|uniref:enoyl-CoA hydratase/isomerase family protein n=1 Tax=Roseomonas sp. AR75 TaxID=2562311 RepID=UPI0010C1397D|nr:enoyl-CoA hydratase/isomerase family protein [Roseomonas sp. AR75]
MSDTQVMLREDRGGVRILTMNRPDKLNALNTDLTRALHAALWDAAGDDAVRVIILTGAGRGFCAGADVTEFKHLTADNPREIAARGDLTMRLHASFAQIDKPILCAINGFAMGGGAGLALAGDLALMAASAKLGYPEVKRGAVPAIVLANLVRQLGPKAAFELVTLGEPLTAEQALALRIINRVVPDAEMLAEAVTMAEKLAACGQDALFATKRLFHRVAALPLQPALEVARDANVIMRGYGARSTV